MKVRIQANELPNAVQKALGAIANKGLLRPQDVIYQEDERQVTFRFRRFPILRKSMLSRTRQSASLIPSRITIRNVSACRIEDTETCEEITILFGIGMKGDEIFLSSAEERSGTTCYMLRCTVSEIDVEIHDE